MLTDPTDEGFDVQYVDVVGPPSLTVNQAQSLHDIAERYDGIFVHFELDNSKQNVITIQFQFYNKQATKEATKAFRKYLRRHLPRKTWLVETYPPESKQPT